MRSAATASVLAHAFVLGAVLVPWHWRPTGADEVPARIEMVFGRNALAQGANAAPLPTTAQALPTAAATPAPPLPAGEQPAAPPSVRSEQIQPRAAAPPTRLGDGLVGFDVPTLDPGIVEAQSDPGNRPPPYPDGAFARREHGQVVLRIHVRADGLVGRIDTLQTSGYADLDAAAVTAARRWRFIPQLRDGEAVASTRDQAMDFVLE